MTLAATSPILLKRCSRCGETKPPSEFYVRKPGGLLRSHCKSCFYDANHPRSIEWAKRHWQYQYKPQTDGRRASTRKWMAQNWERMRAVKAANLLLSRALRAKLLVRGETCEWCGSAIRIQAAHKDYSKPLEVLWLCSRCHVKWDHDEPKSIGREAVA